ncbi:MAG TPA: hypothetical protein DHU79_01165 [Clostridiales bacterium]|nr:hypothetical protein [Clostridiales bacterium]
MKNKKLIVALMLVAVMVCAFVFAACDNTNGDTHQCQHKCEQCGKCTSDCTDEACKDKCPGHGTAKAPVISVVPAQITINAGEEIDLMLGVSATDEVDGTVNVTITDDNDFDNNTVGTYTITYSAKNSHNVTATATRTIVVNKALSALALEVKVNKLGETKWQGTKINFANELYKELTADTTLEKQSGVFHNGSDKAITLNIEGGYGCSAIITANGVVVEGRDGANGKLVNQANPTRAGSNVKVLTVDGEEVSVSSAFAKVMTIPAGGYAIVIQANYAGTTADTDGRGFMNYNVIGEYGNVVRLLWVDDNKVITPYVDQAPAVSGNTKLLVQLRQEGFDLETEIVKGITARDDKGTFDVSDDVNIEKITVVNNGGFDINKEGTYTVKLSVTDGKNTTEFTREVEVKADGFGKVAVGEKEYLVLNDNIAIDQDLTAVGKYSFIVYTAAFNKEIALNNGHGIAFVVNKYGKLVRIYDGANGKYYDESNAGGIQDETKCTPAGYIAEAMASRKDGEIVIIAPNSTANNAEGGSRKFFLNAKTIGADVTFPGITFEAQAYTFTVGEKTFTATEDKYAYNKELAAGEAAKMKMVVFTKAFTGNVVINGFGAAVVIDQYGTLVKVIDGANGGLYDATGKTTEKVNTNTYANDAFAALADGEILVVFPNDGANAADSARTFALGLRTDGSIGKKVTLTGFNFADEPKDEVTVSVNGKSYTVDTAKVAVNTTTKTATDYSFYIFTTAFTGSLNFANGYGAAFVMGADGKVARIYDGANAKYYDADNTEGITGKITAAGYLTAALDSLKANEWLLVAVNKGGANEERAFLLGNKTIGAELTVSGITVKAAETDFTSKVVVNGNTFYNATVKVNGDIAAKDVDFAVYTYGYNGVVTKAGWSEVFVFDATGKIVKIYDGFNGKYYDADNAGGVAAGSFYTQATMTLDAFNALKPGETMIVGFNGGKNNNAGRAFLVANRAFGKTVTIGGATVPAAATAQVTYMTVTVGTKTFYADASKVAINAEYTGTPIFAIYDYGFTGTTYTGSFGVAFIVDKATDKVVKIYDGASAKYWDAENKGVGNICTAEGYAKEAFDALEEGQYVIIAPNGGTDGNTARGLMYGNRNLGTDVSYVAPTTEAQG